MFEVVKVFVLVGGYYVVYILFGVDVVDFGVWVIYKYLVVDGVDDVGFI